MNARPSVFRTFALALVVVAWPASSRADETGPTSETLRAVVVVTRHGVRSPTDATEMNPYAAKPWPAWSVPPGDLTPNGARLMTAFGRAYRATYAARGLWPADGCPAAGSVYVWADVDERTRATGAALLQGLAPGCGLVAKTSDATVDPLFHPLPALGKADASLAHAALAGAVGDDPAALVAANVFAFRALDGVLGCTTTCTPVSSLPVTIVANKNGLASLSGAVDVASTAVEDLLLAYADGQPAPGWGKLDAPTLTALSALHVLKGTYATRTPYAARVLGSNLVAHVTAALDRAAGEAPRARDGVPASARFVLFAGHDTNLDAIAGDLRLSWVMPGYQPGDTPPGGALVFELSTPPAPAAPLVRAFFTAQSLADMRALPDSAMPRRVPIFVPGCPALACPLPDFDRVTALAIDPTFTNSW